MLSRAIASVLGQSFRDFILLVSDNASNDDTAGVVASFRDPRIVYRPLTDAIGRAANFNRLIELADTEFLVILGDDDELDPEHLSLTVDALRQWPTIGVVHTGYVIVDRLGNALTPPVRYADTEDSVVLESGAQFIERSMKKGPSVCISSAVFRRAALLSAGGLRSADGVIDDLPMLLRLATDWDFAYVNRPLAHMRAHPEASSSSLGSFTRDGFRSSRSVPDIIYEHRRKFVAEADLAEGEAGRLIRIAEKMHRRDVLGHLSMRADTGDGSVAALRALRGELMQNPRLGLDPITWRFVAGQLGGRRLRESVRRARSTASRVR